MDSKDRSDLLWSLASQPELEGRFPELGDDLLERYREGVLDPEEEKAVEAGLASSRKARERLAELAGVPLPRPPLHLRRKILEHRPGLEGSRRSWWGRYRWWLAATAPAAVALFLLPLFLLPPGLPAGAEFDLTVRGLAEVRGDHFPGQAPLPIVEAFPDTRIQLRVEPRGEALREVEFSLFRQRRDTLERLTLEPPMRLERLRGAALIEGPAGALNGGSSGTATLFVLVHHPDDPPPESLRFSGGDAVASLAPGTTRRVYPWQLRLLPADRDKATLEEEK